MQVWKGTYSCPKNYNFWWENDIYFYFLQKPILQGYIKILNQIFLKRWNLQFNMGFVIEEITWAKLVRIMHTKKIFFSIISKFMKLTLNDEFKSLKSIDFTNDACTSKFSNSFITKSISQKLMKIECIKITYNT